MEKTSKVDPSNQKVTAAQASKHEIYIKGARNNNLKDVDLRIPKNQLVVVTGVSGSGKSSITMDTLHAEGQRRYVESLSSYARQFLGRMKKPDVDLIHGICPAIAIEQKVSTSNARSTVGTLTEIYDFLRMLFARIGITYSPISGQEVKRHQVRDVITYLSTLEEGTKVILHTPFSTKYADRTLETELDLLQKKGYTRMLIDGKMEQIIDILEEKDTSLLHTTLDQLTPGKYSLLIDRFVIKKEDEENEKRIADSIQTAFFESQGSAILQIIGGEEKLFNTRFELDGIEFQEPSPQLFNFNNPYGACPQCEGFGRTMGIDPKKVIPNQSLSLYEEAIAPWKGEKGKLWLKQVIYHADKYNIDIHKPYAELTKKQLNYIWEGSKDFAGINQYFDELEAQVYKIQNRVMLARYRGKTTCGKCNGGRLRPETQYVKINEKTISDLVMLPIDELVSFFKEIKLSKHHEVIAKRLLLEINSRLQFMVNVGLGYLTLNRVSSTLSGGETQRINLTRMLGSNLTSSMYILDEPSIGLHPRDTARLVNVLRRLRDLGNTVIVVEHEEDIIASADYLVDVGPKAGVHGGEIVFAGPYEKIELAAPESLTTKYMTGKMQIAVPEYRRQPRKWISIKGASLHNIKNVDFKIPIQAFSVVSGVSGSGKTTLVKQILYPAIKDYLNEPHTGITGSIKSISGDLKHISQVDLINQNPIGKSSRSNPVTYVKAYDEIRSLFSQIPLSKVRGFQPRHFSFNVDGGRCDTCKGEGEQIIEMQFLADVRLECETCGGKRFKREVLEVKYREHSIHDILNLTVDEALVFFEDHKNIYKKLKPLSDVGLGYITLGQSSSTLSGGEAQRVKLAYYLGLENNSKNVFFIFDEPTTGLHFHDTQKLLIALNALVDKGHTVLVVEHNLEVMKCADYILDIGPEAGKNGGTILYQGDPKGLLEVKESHTAQYLQEKLN